MLFLSDEDLEWKWDLMLIKSKRRKRRKAKPATACESGGSVPPSLREALPDDYVLDYRRLDNGDLTLTYRLAGTTITMKAPNYRQLMTDLKESLQRMAQLHRVRPRTKMGTYTAALRF